jgi:outer membrane protein OmpA-like peptidoglycan-associated protein
MLKWILWVLFSVAFAGGLFAQQTIGTIYIQRADNYKPLRSVKLQIDTFDQLGQAGRLLDTLVEDYKIEYTFSTSKKYHIKVEKKGFYAQDSLLLAPSRARRFRAGLFLTASACHYIEGDIRVNTSRKLVSSGKILIENLSQGTDTTVLFSGGLFKYCGRCGDHYRLTPSATFYFEASKEVTLAAVSCKSPYERMRRLDLTLDESYDLAFYKGAAMAIEELTFTDKSTTLTPEGEEALAKLGRVLNKMPELRLTVVVYTAQFRERVLNRKLVEKRARIIDQKLTALGVAPYRYFLSCKTTGAGAAGQQVVVSVKS